MSLFKFDAQALHQQAASTLPATPAVDHSSMYEASKRLALDYDLVVPDMVRPYHKHQAAAHVAANMAIATWGCAILGDDMGLGKTQVLFGLVNERLNGGYAIMVAPPVALAGYQEDLAASFPHLRLVQLKGRTADFTTLPTADIYFISDDSLTMQAWLTDVREEKHNGVTRKVHYANAFTKGAALYTRDEIHRDKGNQAKPTGRAKVMLAVGEAMRSLGKVIIGATGTLLTNRPVEGFLPLQAIGGERLLLAITPGSRKASGYLWHYCQPVQVQIGNKTVTQFGTDMSRMVALHDMLRSTVYVRREKSDLPDGALPHSGWIVKPIALPDANMRRYRRIEKDFLALVLEEDGPEAMWRKGRAEAITRMQAMWAEAGNAKADAAVEYVSDLVSERGKVVVFYYHTDTYMSLANGFAKAGIRTTTINGMVTGEERRHAIRRFQDTDSDTTVCLAQIRAAGMAVTLTAAADAVFVQVPWSAGDLKQAADRILRCDDITQARADAGGNVTWHVLQAAYANGDTSFDMAMWGVLENKAKVCDAVNAGRPVTMSDESIMREALMAWVPQAQARMR